MSTSRVALILGAGSGVGRAACTAFHSQGYRVAVVSRSASEDLKDAELSLKVDLSDPAKVQDVFERVTRELGVPNVIIYNAYHLYPLPSSDPLSLTLPDFVHSLAVNTTSAYAAALEAVRGFAALSRDADAPKVFIYTGNILSERVMPALLSLGVGKAASAHWVESAAEGYKGKGWGFYYVDQRSPDGFPAGKADAQAHADTFVELAQRPSPGLWQWTFVKGEGYKSF